MECFLRYAEQLSIGDEVLIQNNFELSPEKVVNVSDISRTGKNHSFFLVYYFCSLCMPLKMLFVICVDQL